jgi:hypothetical protein
MSYARAVAGYLVVALVAAPLVTHLWAQWRLCQILATGSGITLREYVAPSWRHLAARVRTGEVTLTREQQAARFDRIAGFFESEARSEQERAQTEVTGAQLFFRISLGVFLAQVALAVMLGIGSVREQRRVAGVPPS